MATRAVFRNSKMLSIEAIVKDVAFSDRRTSFENFVFEQSI